MTAKPPPMTPNAVPIGQALQQSAPLTRLRGLLADSNARFATVRPFLPGVMAAHVRPGPVDEEGWSLLAANAAVAAKLRQLQPRLEAALLAQGWPAAQIRIKVRPG